ncbi:acyl-CoA thioesterase [Streptomyces sp. NPDC002499]
MHRPPSDEEVDGAGVLARAVHRGRVEWMDTDAAGHHHNTAVVRFVEAAEAMLMREHGVDGYFGAAPRVRYEVDFASPLWFGQEVTSTVVVERVGRSSLTFRFEVWGEEFEQRPRRLAASGRYVTVHVPRGARESAPWPTEWVARLGGETVGHGADGG